MSDIIVKIDHVNKSYGTNHVVKDLCMEIYRGEFLTMLGPSGCGKTTTLRMIAGFESITEGDIQVENESVQYKEAYERDVNTVFQNYALFPHMTIFDNIAFGLNIKKVPKEEIKERVTEMLELVQLAGYEKRKPHQLSGGQKQRVAIARALINHPKVLLLDEPLGALDLKLRKQMQLELKQLQRKLGITFIYVTHDQEEALTMSDRIAIMNQGVLEQIGTPNEVYDTPASKFVADFIGESNVFYGVVKKVAGEELSIDLETGSVPAIGKGFRESEIIYLSVRPEKAALSTSPVEGIAFQGVIKEQVYVGSTLKTIVTLSDGNDFKIMSLAGGIPLPVGTAVYVSWKKEDAVVMHSNDDVVYSAMENIVMG